MSFDDKAFSDPTLRQAITREASEHLAPLGLKQDVQALFKTHAPVAPPKGGGLPISGQLLIATLLVAGLVTMAGYQIYATFFEQASAAAIPDPIAVWREIASSKIPEGMSPRALKDVPTSESFTYAALPKSMSDSVSAYISDHDCGSSPVIEYGMGDDRVRLILRHNSQYFKSPDGADHYEKVYDDSQVAGVLRDDYWVIAIAPKSFSADKLKEMVRSAVITRVEATATQPAN